MNRKENIKELRNFIKQNIQKVLKEYNFDFLILKNHVKNQILNEKGKEIVYNTLTGINKLEDTLKSILKPIEIAYKSLTTDKSQRDSFSKHLLNAIENMLKLKDQNVEAGENAVNAIGSPDRATTTNITEASTNIDIKFDNSKFDENGVMKPDSDKVEKSPEDVEKDAFKIPGMDETGADEAYDVFNKIEKQIEDRFLRLRNKLDRKIYSQLLPKNIEAYIQMWEEQITSTLDKVNV